MAGDADNKIEVDGRMMTICERCKFIQHEAIAKIIEGEEN